MKGLQVNINKTLMMAYLAVIFLFLPMKTSYAATNTEGIMSVKINQHCDFNKIDLNNASGKVACSPDVTDRQIRDGITGIFINMPGKIKLQDSNEIKVCMLSIMTGVDSAKYGGSELLILKSDVTNGVINGRFVDDERLTELPVENNTQEEQFEMIEEDYFNFNLTTYMNFEKKPGIYHFYITMGPFSSNAVTFEIVDRQ